MKLENGVFLYMSKKVKKYVPVKDKSLDSIYLEVEGKGGALDFILPSEILSD